MYESMCEWFRHQWQCGFSDSFSLNHLPQTLSGPYAMRSQVWTPLTRITPCVAVVANAVTHLLLMNKHSAGLQLHIVGPCRDMLDDCANTGMCTLLCTFCSFVHHQMFAATTIQEIDGSIVCNGYPEIGGSDSCCVGTCADGCLQGGVRASRICGDVMEVS
jgi:hypothetical protein